MTGWWVHDLYQQGRVAELVSWIFWVIFSITMHELAHGWAALWQGDDTPRRLNRLTPNPLVHMGGWSLLMFALIGIAWGVMPTDPSKYRWRRKGRIIVAGAGPAMNVFLAIASLSVAALWVVYGPVADPLQENVRTFFLTGGWLNLVLALFNLLPVPPLDGSSILMGLSFRFYQWFQNPQVTMIGFLVILAIFVSGIGGFVFLGALSLSHLYMEGVINLLP